MTIKTEQLKQLLADYAKVPEAEASAFVDALVDTLLQHLKQGEAVTVGGLGEFYIVESQQGRRVAFRPEDKLKEAVNAPFSFFEPVVIAEGRPEAIGTISDGTISDETISDEAISDEAISDETISDEAISDEAISDETIGEPVKKGWSWAACLIPVLVLMGMGGYYWTLHEDPTQLTAVQEDAIAAVALIDTIPAEPVEVDTVPIAAEPADTIPAASETKPEVPKVVAPRPPRPDDRQIMHNPDGTPMTVSLGVGERLTLLSQRHYGDKAFWGYIYEVNAFQLSNPNVVPCHVKLLLPDPVYYGIDASDSLSVKRGKQKQSEIFKNVTQ